jgi:hypothetical protein
MILQDIKPIQSQKKSAAGALTLVERAPPTMLQPNKPPPKRNGPVRTPAWRQSSEDVTPMSVVMISQQHDGRGEDLASFASADRPIFIRDSDDESFSRMVDDLPDEHDNVPARLPDGEMRVMSPDDAKLARFFMEHQGKNVNQGQFIAYMSWLFHKLSKMTASFIQED